MKNMYTALSELSVYINSDLRHNVCKHYVHNMINLSNNYKHAVN